MKNILLFILIINSSYAYSKGCIENLKDRHCNDGVEEIKKYDDLNNDNVPETLVLLRGSMTLRYGVIYKKSKLGCYEELYSGSENVGITELPETFNHNGRIKNNTLNGYKILRDSSWDGSEVSIILYAYDKNQKRYREILTTTQYNWFF